MQSSLTCGLRGRNNGQLRAGTPSSSARGARRAQIRVNASFEQFQKQANDWLSTKWSQAGQKAKELDAEVGASRKARQAFEDFARSWPSTRRQISEFVNSPLGKVTIAVAIVASIQTGFIWSLLSWVAMFLFLSPLISYLIMSYAVRNAQTSGSGGAQTAGGPFNYPRGAAAGGMSPEMMAQMMEELRRQQGGAARPGGAAGGSAGRGAAGGRRTRFDDDGPIVDAQWTEVKK